MKKNGNFQYGFLIPLSGKGKSNSDNFKIASYDAKNFNEAFVLLENNFGDVELGHLGTVFLDTLYMAEGFENDFKHIEGMVKLSPLTDYFIFENGIEILKVLGNAYDSNPDSFVESCFKNERNKYLCSMPEIYMSLNNCLYTSLLPVISIENNSLPACSGFIAWSKKYGIDALIENDFDIVCKYIAYYGKTSQGFRVSISQNELNIKFKNETYNKKEISNLSQRLFYSGFDIFNILYYAKKCFATLNEYECFLECMNLSNIKFK